MEETFEFLGETQRGDKQYVGKAKKGRGVRGDRVERYNEEGQKDV